MDVDTEYYIRLLLLLVKGGMQVCKAIILRELAGLGLDVVLKPLEPALKKKLLKSQYIVLFPKVGTPDVEDLDISLLTVVLLNVLVLSTTDAQYIKVIKQTRNKLAHNTAASIDQTDYTKTNTNLKDALTKLTEGLDTTLQKECSELIQKYTTEPLDEMTIIKYVKELRNDDELLHDFEQILEKQSTDIKQEIKASESRMQESISDVRENIIDAIQKLQRGQSSEESLHHKITGSIPECESCCLGNSANTSSWYCEFCSTFACLDCKNCMHTSGKKHKCHRIMEGEPITLDMNGLNMCDSHSKILLYFCVKDERLCCKRCLDERHEQCQNIVSISGINDGSTFNPSLEILSFQNEAKHMIAWSDSITKDLNKEIENIPSYLEKQRNTVLDLFDREALTLKEKANTIQSTTLKYIQENHKYCENFIENMEFAKRSLVNMAKFGSSEQKFIAKLRTREFQEKVKLLTSISVFTCNVVEERMSGLSLRQSEALSIQVKSPDIAPVKLFQAASVELKQSEDDEKMPFYTGMDFLPDGRLVVADNYNNKCLIFDEMMEKVGSYQLSFNPHSVIAVSEMEVAITSGSQCKIYFLRVSKSNEIIIIRKCEVKTQYCSIIMRDGGHFVVGTIDDERPARIVSLTGEEKDFNINFPDKKYPIGTSACTYIRNCDKVVLTDRNEHTVYIYDVATKPEMVVKDVQIQEPRGVAVGPFDRLFVCSRASDSIVQLSHTGRIITSHKLNMKFPYRICVSKDKTRIAVSNSYIDQKILQVFNIAF